MRTLLDYHYWARDRTLDAVAPLSADQFTRDLGSSFRSIRDTLVHVYSAEWVWHSRWRGVSPAAMLQASELGDVPTLQRAWREHEQRMRAFFTELTEEGATRPISYKNLAGQENTSSLSQMLQHVVDHASYHRGQVTTMLRQLGAPPPRSMDLIAFYREAAPRPAA
jgi:uncharacterized damage-inducible protein DinB